MSAEDEQKLKQAEKCHICGRLYKQRYKNKRPLSRK